MHQQLLGLYAQLDTLYQGIFDSVCASCTDHDCEGYVWLLPEEEMLLLEAGVPVVEINGNARFIHSFPEEEGELVIDRPKPPCILREDKKCSVYNLRPLVCRMYPVGLVTHENTVSLVLHKDCAFTRRQDEQARTEFIQEVSAIFQNLTPELTHHILTCYLHVDEVSALPDGPNIYEMISPFGTNTGLKKGGEPFE